MRGQAGGRMPATLARCSSSAAAVTAGETRQLRAVDADGDRTEVAANFSASSSALGRPPRSTFEIGQASEVSLAGDIRAAATGSGSATSEVR